MRLKLRDGGFWRRNRFVLAAFAIPFAMMLAGYACAGAVPFGDVPAPTRDWETQYYPFLLDLRRNLRSGEFPMWSWTGGGFNYIAMAAYYLISPWNLLACLLPDWLLPAFATVSTCARVAMAGPAMAVFLRGMYGHDGARLTLAGCCFACCGFLMGYHWNVIWLDVVALTPLVILYEARMLESDRVAPYILSLWASLCMNFYIGFFTCVFVLITFIGFHFMKWDGWAGLGRRFLRIAAASLVAIGMASVVLLPALMALRDTFAVGDPAKDLFEMNFSTGGGPLDFLSNMALVAGNMLNFTEPAVIAYNSLPNSFCGTVTLAMYLLFLLDKRIGRRQRLFSLGLLAFLFTSCVLRVLDYAWHGMHFPNMIPYRFMYLSSFVLVDGAFREAVLPWEWDRRRMACMAAAMAGVAASGIYGMRFEAFPFQAWAVGALAAIAIVLLFVMFSNKAISAEGLSKALSVFVLVQCCAACVCGVWTVFEDTRVKSGCLSTAVPDEAAAVRLVDRTYRLRDGRHGDWRMECLLPSYANSGFTYGYEGIGLFSSMADAGVSRFFDKLDGSGNPPENRYEYVESGPVMDAVMGIRYLYTWESYLYSWDGGYRNTYGLKEIGRESNIILLENKYCLPMGFMVEDALAGWGQEEMPEHDWSNRLDSQEAFFRAASGVDGELFIPVEPSGHTYDDGEDSVSGTGDGVYVYSYGRDPDRYYHMILEYDVPEDGLYFAYVAGGALKAAYVATGVGKTSWPGSYPGVRCIGELEAGGKISVEVLLDGKRIPEDLDSPGFREVHVYVERMDTDVFEAGFDRLSRYGMELVSRTGSGLSGRIETGMDGLLFLSVPSASGWTARVDGEPAEILSIGGGMTALWMSAGEHEVEMSYRTPGLLAGAAIAAMSVCAGAAWCFLQRRKRGSPGAGGLRGRRGR